MTDVIEDKQALHELIDQMPGEAVQALRAVAQLMVHREMEYDDEELSPEGERMLAEGRDSLASGPLTDHEDFRRELGL